MTDTRRISKLIPILFSCSSEESQLNLSVESLQTERSHWEPLSSTIEADEVTKMSHIQGLRVLVKHFLSVAADRIMKAVDQMIAGYEGEMHQFKRETSRQCKMLDVILQPEIRLTRIPGTSMCSKCILISPRMAVI